MATTVKAEKIIFVVLALIAIDENFNVRSSMSDSGGVESDPNGMEGLITSMLEHGQDEPVVLRPNPNPKTAQKQPYALTSGHRRCEAWKRIEQKTGELAQVKAVVKNMTESEAIAYNIRENTARENLSGPDLAFGVAAMHANDPKSDGTSIAASIGMTQPYISKLLRIMTKTDPKVTAKWRKDPLKLSVDKMASIAGLDRDKQADAYKTMQKEIEDRKAAVAAGGGATRGQDAWLTTCKENAQAAGKVLGMLVKAGLISINEHENFFKAALPLLVKVNKKATEEQLDQVAASIDVGFDEGQKETLAEKTSPAVANATPAN